MAVFPVSVKLLDDVPRYVDLLADGDLAELVAAELPASALAFLVRHHPVLGLIDFVAHQDHRHAGRTFINNFIQILKIIQKLILVHSKFIKLICHCGHTKVT